MRCTFILLLSLLALSAQAQPNATPAIRYVSATGTNTNPASATSWATSTTDLQGAINALATTGGQVWVRTGTYKPGGSANTTNRSTSFSMRNSVAIYGGFAGSETTLGGRSAGATSLLSGDINNDNFLSGNSFHVINNPTGLNQTALLDGFVISGGNADATTAPDNLGGGMLNLGASPQLLGCTFVGNAAAVQGGGLYNRQGSPRLERCLFQNNFAPNGAGIYNDGTTSTTSLTAINCLWLGNIATTGGAVYNATQAGGTCTATFTNCTFRTNLAFGGGGALFNARPAGTLSCTLLNCLLWDNGGSTSIGNQPAVNLTQASYSLFEPSVTGYGSLTGNQTTSTLPFLSATSNLLTPVTPAVDGGDPASTTATVGALDMAGNPRLVNNRIDMGSHEFQGLARLYVRASTTTGTNSGESWTNALTDLQMALRQNYGVREIWVANGTYRPTTTVDRSVSFTLTNGLSLYGGFVGTETSLDQRPPITYASPSGSILSGDIGVPGVSNDNSFQVVDGSFALSSTFDGFVVTGANADNFTTAIGGGMICSNQCKVQNSRFVRNRTAGSGGGLVYAIPTSTSGNVGQPFAVQPAITNCIFDSNTALVGGGAAILGFPGIIIIAQLNNCLFSNNSARDGGGLATIGSVSQMNILINNNTFADNAATRNGRAILDSATFQVNIVNQLDNCILTNNGGANAISLRGQRAILSMSQSLLEPGVTNFFDNGGNIVSAQNPFATLTPYQLNACSPAINMGPFSSPLPFDGNNQSRMVGGRLDAGAFEYQPAIGQVPTILLPTASAQACANSAFQTSASVAGIPANNTIRWFRDNILLTGQTTPTLSLTAAVAGIYRLDVQNECGVQSATLALSTSAPPNVSVFTSGGLSCSVISTTLTTLGTVLPPASYTLLNTGQTNSTGQFLVSQPGNYTIQVADRFNCTTQAQSNVVTFLPNGMASVKDGNWTDPTVWQCGRVPLVTDTVWLRHRVILPANTSGSVFRLRYDTTGRLLYQTGGRLQLNGQ